MAEVSVGLQPEVCGRNLDSSLAEPIVGRTVHRGLEIYYRHRQQNVRLPAAEVVERLLAQWNEAVVADGVRFSTSDAEAAARQQSLDLVHVYLANLPADEPRPLAIETALVAPLLDPVTGTSLGVPLVGVIDLILPGPEGAIITDFKTTARGGELLEISHELQLTATATCSAKLLPCLNRP